MGRVRDSQRSCSPAALVWEVSVAPIPLNCSMLISKQLRIRRLQHVSDRTGMLYRCTIFLRLVERIRQISHLAHLFASVHHW
jgi:hypothetical protein